MIASLQKEKQIWLDLSQQLNLEYAEGLESFINSSFSQHIKEAAFPGQSTQDMQKFLNNPLVSYMMQNLLFIHIHGRYNEYNVHIIPAISQSSVSSDSSQTHYTNIILDFKHSYDYGLDIQKSGFFSRLGKSLFKKQIIIRQDPFLDRMLRITAKKREQAEAFLSDTRIQSALLLLYEKSPNFQISDWGIRFPSPERHPGAENIRELLNTMAQTADSFY